MVGRILVTSSTIERRLELRAALEFEGHQISETETAGQTVRETCSGLYDVLILDGCLEGTPPHELCRMVRPKSALGIIVLNRDDTAQASIDVLNAGADDYVPAPFVLAELLSRVRAILRRVTRSSEQGRQIVLQDRAIDLRSHKIKGPGGRVVP